MINLNRFYVDLGNFIVLHNSTKEHIPNPTAFILWHFQLSTIQRKHILLTAIKIQHTTFLNPPEFATHCSLCCVEGRGPQDLHAIYCNESSSNMPPMFSNWALHLVQGQMEILNHVPIALTILHTPWVQEVICRLPHWLKEYSNLR